MGESSIHSLDDLKRRRPQEVAFLLAKLVLEKYFRQDGTQRDAATPEHCFDADVQAWLFPQVLGIARCWLAECVVCKDNTFPQLLLLIETAHGAADRIYHAIATSTEGSKMLMPILRPYDTIGSTHYVDFNTSRATYLTRPDKCHVSHVVLDSQWEGKMAHALETMDEVVRYVKNDHLGFTSPYTHNGEERNYVPDYLAQLNDGREDLLNVIIEVTGERKRDKEAKVATARDLWVPAVNNHGAWGRWVFVEVTDPWDAQHKLHELL